MAASKIGIAMAAPLPSPKNACIIAETVLNPYGLTRLASLFPLKDAMGSSRC